jgi:precorrin-4 methylase
MIYIIGIGPGGSPKYLTSRASEVICSVGEAIYVGEMIGPGIKGLFAGRNLTTGRTALAHSSG